MSASAAPGPELEVRGLRAVFWLCLVLGAGGLALAVAFEGFRTPFRIFLFLAVTLFGLVGVLDCRVKLALSPQGIRYARCGPAVIPWREFAGFRPTAWRHSVYLQLMPR